MPRPTTFHSGCYCNVRGPAGPRRRVDRLLVALVVLSAVAAALVVWAILAAASSAPAPVRLTPTNQTTCIKVNTTGSYWHSGDADGGTVCDDSAKPVNLSWAPLPLSTNKEK
jgi:hypothetical protein